jgi:hypothetical protein
MFAIVLSHMDRNFGLRLYKAPECRRIWVYLFAKSFKEKRVQELRQFRMDNVQTTDRLEVPSDGTNKRPFQCRFPFSFYISETLQQMRETAETVATKAANSSDRAVVVAATSNAVQRQFEMLSFEQDLSSPFSSDMIQRYVFDFAAMHLLNSDALPKEIEAAIFFRVLELYNQSESLSTLAAVHGRYWDCETRLALYCQLMDAVPSSVQPVNGLLLESSVETCMEQAGVEHETAAVDVAVLSLVLTMVEPTNEAQQWDSAEDYGRWCTQYDLAKPAVLSLLDEIKKGAGAEHAAVLQATLQWEKLRLIDQFLRDVALPLSMLPEDSLAVAAAILRHDIRTPAVFRVMVKLLCQDLTQSLSSGSGETQDDRWQQLRRGAPVASCAW